MISRISCWENLSPAMSTARITAEGSCSRQAAGLRNGPAAPQSVRETWAAISEDSSSLAERD